MQNLSSFDCIAVASLIVSIAAFVVARKTMKDAEEDWRQRKWFDLYLEADKAYNALERYQVNYKQNPVPQNLEQTRDWNNLMSQMRLVHSLAVVFPKNPATDILFSATAVFANPASAFLPERLPKLSEALEALRQKALLKRKVV